MRVERGPARLVGWLVVSCACLACRVACAEPLPINVDVQYQRIEALGQVREYWARNLDATYSTQLNPSLLLSSQFRINAVSFLHRPDERITPFGSLTLTNSFASIGGSYRPIETTNAAGLVTRQREAQLFGFIAPLRLPRIDVEWTNRRTLAGDGVNPQLGLTRSGRLTWARGMFDVRGGVGDIQFGEDANDPRRTSQQNWDAGVGLRTGRARWNLSATLDVSEVRRSGSVGAAEVNRTQLANMSFTNRLSTKSDWNINYQYRDVTQTLGQGDPQLATHDGAASWNYRPTRNTLVMASFGVRPVTTATGGSVTLGYTMFSATANGRVRPGWTGLATVAQSLNHQPGSLAFWVGTYRGSSNFVLVRGLSLDLDAMVTANGDTAANDQRTSSQGLVGISAIPLRGFTIKGNLRGYRSGPDVGRAVTRSASRNLDVRWQPRAGLDLGASLARSSALPQGDPTLTTRQLFARYAPGSRLQLDAHYSRSNTTRRDAGVARLPGREVWSGRLLAGLGRRFRVSIGGALSDPGTVTRSQQFDATLSARLGGGT